MSKASRLPIFVDSASALSASSWCRNMPTAYIAAIEPYSKSYSRLWYVLGVWVQFPETGIWVSLLVEKLLVRISLGQNLLQLFLYSRPVSEQEWFFSRGDFFWTIRWLEGGGTAWHRSIICTPHPVVVDSNLAALGISIRFLNSVLQGCCLVRE